MSFLKDIKRIADALELMARQPVPEPIDIPPAEAFSYYDDTKAAMLELIDEAKEKGWITPEAAEEVAGRLGREPTESVDVQSESD